jgi:arylsulfatase A-like enzyme
MDAPNFGTLRFAGPLALACLPVGLVGAGCGDGGESQAVPPELIVWFEVDTLRADALGCYGYRETADDGRGVSPSIDRLASESWQFERAYSAAPWTAPSLVSQLTGLAPWEHDVNLLLQRVPDRLVCFPELLGAEGWSSAAVTANFVTAGQLGFWQGFDRVHDELATGHEGRTGAAVVSAGLGLLDELWGARDRGVLLWLHLFEPHYRYEAGDGRRFGPGFGSLASAPYTGELDGSRSLDALREGFGEGRYGPADAAYLRGLYQSEVAAADEAFGQLREGLEARGLWERALLLFTADHGEELGERGWVGHTVHLRDELVRVPLLIKPPRSWNAQPTRWEQPVSQLDLSATLLDWTGTFAPREADVAGRSLAPWLAGRAAAPPRRWVDFGTNFEPLRDTPGARTKRARLVGRLDAESLDKWVWSEVPESAFQRFDLREDPAERAPLAGDPTQAPAPPVVEWRLSATAESRR